MNLVSFNSIQISHFFYFVFSIIYWQFRKRDPKAEAYLVGRAPMTVYILFPFIVFLSQARRQQYEREKSKHRTNNYGSKDIMAGTLKVHTITPSANCQIRGALKLWVKCWFVRFQLDLHFLSFPSRLGSLTPGVYCAPGS